MGYRIKALEIMQNHKLGIEMVPGKGRGVYAIEDLKKGEVLEHCPAILLLNGQWPFVELTILERYLLPFGDTYAAVGGYAMFYNHDDDPNAIWDDKMWADNNPMVTFTALRAIKAGEPITVDYADGEKITWNEDGNWTVSSDGDPVD